jgi:hypothetical protein
MNITSEKQKCQYRSVLKIFSVRPAVIVHFVTGNACTETAKQRFRARHPSDYSNGFGLITQKTREKASRWCGCEQQRLRYTLWDASVNFGDA